MGEWGWEAEYVSIFKTTIVLFFYVDATFNFIRTGTHRELN